MGSFRQFPYSNFHEMNMDEIIKIVTDMLEDWAQYYTTWDNWKAQVTQEWAEMQSFINNYFDNLDVQTEINNKITAMVRSGEFSRIVDPYVPPAVATWLAEHITTPETVVIDDSLSIAGAAADAKATGDAINDLKGDLINADAVDYEILTGTLIEEAAVYQVGNVWVAVDATSFDNPENYTLKQYEIKSDEIYKIITATPRRYGFSNYDFDRVSGTNLYLSDVAEDTINIEDITYKYLYIVNSTDSAPVDSLVVEKIVFPLKKAISEIETTLDNSNLYKISVPTATVLNKVAWYDNSLVSSEGWADESDYTVKCYQIDGAEIIHLTVTDNRRYGFSNYTYSSGLGMDSPRGIAEIGTNTIVNTNKKKYLYVVNSTPSIAESSITITALHSSILDLEKYKTTMMGLTVIVAASNAPERVKKYADYICDGTNDEVEIQNALNSINDYVHGTVLLSGGDFYIDSFPTTTSRKRIALNLSRNTTGTWDKVIKGIGRRTLVNTTIHITADALTDLGTDDGFVFSTNEFVFGRTVEYHDMIIRLADNQHKVTVLDNTVLSAGVCSELTISGVESDIANTDDTTMPSTECIGITGYCGDDSGSLNIIKNCFVTGFYEGYRLGGEHLVCIQLSARYNYYSYTFGNYDWHIGVQSHPITLINCCDEHSAYLPKFVRNGRYDEEDDKAMQEIDFTGFNLELMRPSNFGGSLVGPAEETEPNTFCGRIDFTGYGTPNTIDGTQIEPSTNNQPDIQFWASGSGENFITRNMAHPLKGSTSDRPSIPTFMQQYFDTTLNKMLIYNGSAWVDMMGTTV